MALSFTGIGIYHLPLLWLGVRYTMTAAEKQHFEQMLKAHPTHPQALLELAGIAFSEGNVEGAQTHLATLRDALSGGSTQVALDLIKLAERYGNAGRLELAEIIGHEARRFDANHGLVWAVHGVIAAQLGSPIEAIRRLENAVRLRPENLDFRFQLACFLGAEARREEAVACFRAIIEARPDYPLAQEKMADQLAALGQTDQALALFRGLTGPDAERLGLKIASLELAKGDIQSAQSTIAALRPELAGGVVDILTQGAEITAACAEVLRPEGADYLYMGQDQTIGSGFVCALDGGGVLGQSDIPVAADGRFFTSKVLHNDGKVFAYDACKYYDGVVTSHDRSILFRSDKQRHETGAHILIGGHWNFGHWWLNHFSRLMLTQDLAGLPLVVHDDIPDQHRECLSRAGYDHLVKVAKSERVSFDRLWVPSMPFCGQEGRLCWIPGFVDFVRQAVRGPAVPRGERKRLYIPRAGAKWRRLVNEDALLDVLRPLGFEVVDPAGLTLAEQIEAAQAAEFIIGPFGAGMNILFLAPADCQIIELKNGPTPMDINPVFSRRIGQTFHAVGPAWIDGESGSRLDADFKVDVPTVLAIIRDSPLK